MDLDERMTAEEIKTTATTIIEAIPNGDARKDLLVFSPPEETITGSYLCLKTFALKKICTDRIRVNSNTLMVI